LIECLTPLILDRFIFLSHARLNSFFPTYPIIEEDLVHASMVVSLVLLILPLTGFDFFDLIQWISSRFDVYSYFMACKV
jgi:hypothetical protein